MAINLSALAPELRRQILEQAGLKPVAAVRRRSPAPKPRARLMRQCSCLCEIFRPDGKYPAKCDGCQKTWPE